MDELHRNYSDVCRKLLITLIYLVKWLQACTELAQWPFDAGGIANHSNHCAVHRPYFSGWVFYS